MFKSYQWHPIAGAQLPPFLARVNPIEDKFTGRTGFYGGSLVRIAFLQNHPLGVRA